MTVPESFFGIIPTWLGVYGLSSIALSISFFLFYKKLLIHIKNSIYNLEFNNLEQRIKNSKTGKLSIKQRDCVNFCFEALKELSPSFSSLYKEHIEDEDGVYYIDFKQVTSKDILGQLKSERSYDNKTKHFTSIKFTSIKV